MSRVSVGAVAAGPETQLASKAAPGGVLSSRSICHKQAAAGLQDLDLVLDLAGSGGLFAASVFTSIYSARSTWRLYTWRTRPVICHLITRDAGANGLPGLIAESNKIRSNKIFALSAANAKILEPAFCWMRILGRPSLATFMATRKRLEQGR